MPLEAVDGVSHDLGEAREVEQIGLDQRHGVLPRRVQLGTQCVRLAFRSPVVQHHARALAVQPPDDGGPDALCAPGDEHNFP